MNMIDMVRRPIRTGIDRLARVLDRATGGKIHPDSVTIVGSVMHLPIAYLIAIGQLVPAAILLIVFGLFDSLDGSLARLQKRASAWGALLDSTTDRMKEVALYAGIVYLLVQTGQPAWAVTMALLACGIAVCVSYSRAVGDIALLTSDKKFPPEQVNKAFRGGLLSFEVRMALLVVGLFANQLPIVVSLIAIGSLWTLISRLMRIAKALG